VGIGLGVLSLSAFFSGVAVGVGVGELVSGLGEVLADVPAPGMGEVLAVSPSEPLGLGERVPPGENEGADTPGDPEQAETAAEASMVMVPQPSMVNLALSLVPARAPRQVRTFMRPPRKAATAIPVKAVDRHPDTMTRSLISRYARRTRRGRRS
jgi:hypothetical protein